MFGNLKALPIKKEEKNIGYEVDYPKPLASPSY
jgi:hypothetical protein